MTEYGVAICIFCGIVIIAAIVLTWLGERQERREREKNDKKNNAKRDEERADESAAANGSCDGKRYIRFESGRGGASRSSCGRNNRRKRGASCRADHGLDARDRGTQSDVG